MLIDLQVDYISGGDMLRGQRSTILEAFPELPNNVATLLGKEKIKENENEVRLT